MQDASDSGVLYHSFNERSNHKMTNFNPQAVLENSSLLLRPLHQNDFEQLYEVAADPKLWEQHPAKERSSLEGFQKFFTEALQTNKAYAIINKADSKIIGTSRYHSSPDADNAIEIGWTFIARKYWGGDYNRMIKQLMLQNAFQHFEFVLFYIDKDNFRSQKAVEKIGAKKVQQLNNKPITFRSANNCVYAIERNAFQLEFGN